MNFVHISKSSLRKAVEQTVIGLAILRLYFARPVGLAFITMNDISVRSQAIARVANDTNLIRS